jgi:hypothetical protein
MSSPIPFSRGVGPPSAIMPRHSDCRSEHCGSGRSRTSVVSQFAKYWSNGTLRLNGSAFSFTIGLRL